MASWQRDEDVSHDDMGIVVVSHLNPTERQAGQLALGSPGCKGQNPAEREKP